MIIILDMGSGETCKNDAGDVLAMINAVDEADNREHEIILKWQLFRGGEFAHLRALHHGVFAFAYDYARSMGYATTASVFDAASVQFLSRFDVPFVKVACIPNPPSMVVNPSIRIGWWPCRTVMSYGNQEHYLRVSNVTEHRLACIREYPAKAGDYVSLFTDAQLRAGISDHTDHTLGMDLIQIYRPELYETHFCLDDQTGPDTGPFALRPAQLESMLEAL